MNAAVSEFKEHYEQFAAANKQFLRVQNDVQGALDKAQSENDIKRSAEIFGDEIFQILRATERKEQLAQAKWTGKLGKFMKSLYPVAKVSLTLFGSIGEVTPTYKSFDLKAANFVPVKWAADGLGIILQV